MSTSNVGLPGNMPSISHVVSWNATILMMWYQEGTERGYVCSPGLCLPVAAFLNITSAAISLDSPTNVRLLFFT